MSYYLDLFTPETWAAFQEHGSRISGFRERQRKAAEKVKPGDILVCYMVRLSRWCGALEVESPSFIDDTPIFSDPDPFVLRFRVRPLVVLDIERAVPIHEREIWSRLSSTKSIEPRSRGWGQHARLRASLVTISKADGNILMEHLGRQKVDPQTYPLSATEQRRLTSKQTIRTIGRSVIVEVPDTEEEHELEVGPEAREVPEHDEDTRESHRVQAAVAKIGAEMGFRIWIPRGDRQKILELSPKSIHSAFLEELPLNYDHTTLRTIEQIDVIWMRNRSMARAFEVEHTTAIYSGLLRMADLLALQPNMDIRLHIVAPDEKRERVLREIRRPVFSLLDRGPLYESCTYLSYDAVKELGSMKHLVHMSDSILEEYVESAQHDEV